jgi:hypothetical protein
VALLHCPPVTSFRRAAWVCFPAGPGSLTVEHALFTRFATVAPGLCLELRVAVGDSSVGEKRLSRINGEFHRCGRF